MYEFIDDVKGTIDFDLMYEFIEDVREYMIQENKFISPS